ncbi:hypothetical protein [Synechococcus sp. CBW1004]|uniref:hypothetical protein n=1 Tax=Synechococcus sp. CBW1004 TaxID=1353136 RepID=UPI0018CD464E|nr:hypothetical protein [Synechococcus sp. CBW1004]QPN63875.1 hypothetical protein H8F25_03210 [Synechococcus sp. CBW1004]
MMLAPALSTIGVALFVIYGLTVFSQLVPLRLLEPAWQLRVAGVLLENGLWPLLGLGLLQLAAYLDPANRRLQARWEGLGRLGVIAVLGFLLMVPVQLVATGLSLQTLDSAQRNRQQRVEANLNRMRQEIRASSSLADLQRRIRDIQAPDLLLDAASLDQSLPELKRSFLASVDQSEQLLQRRFQAMANRGRTWALLQRAGRGVIMALVLAFAYAAATPIAADPDISVLMVWRERLSLFPRRR